MLSAAAHSAVPGLLVQLRHNFFFFLYEFSTEIINKLNETVRTLVWDALLRLRWPLCGSQPWYISLSLPFPRDSRWITTLKY